MAKAEEILVLIVDDEEIIREMLAENISFEGFRTLTASGGLEALGLLGQEKINFVISDVRMPKGDGVFLLLSIKEKFPEIPILLVSGFAEINAEQAINYGAIDLMSKPFSIDKIIEIIKSHCNVES